MESVVLSIGVPMYNCQRFIVESINSILNQSYHNFEIIITDDGSSDNSVKIVESFKDSRIRLIVDNENKGISFRINQQVNLARGEYFVRMDADDIMHPHRLKKQLNVLKNHPEIDVLGTNAYSIDEYSKVVGIRLDPNTGSELLKVENFIHPTIMAKTQWFKNNPYDEKAVRIEDAELWMRTIKENNFMIIVEPLLYYREFGDRYFIKYFKGLKSLIYLIKKHKFSLESICFCVNYVMSSFRSFSYYILDNEITMIKKRNKVLYKDSKLISEKK